MKTHINSLLIKMIRKPFAASVFYPSERSELLQEIEESYLSKFGYGNTDSYGKAIGGIVPHAGYSYSGPCASHVYSNLIKNPKTVFILGTNHSGYGEPIALSDDTWKTPLGTVDVDRKLISSLVKEGYKIDNPSHKREHSIEVQIPFIQNKFPKTEIVPILLSHKVKKSEVMNLAKSISKKEGVFIASSDLTHYGYNYDFVPFDGNREYVRNEIYKIDRGLIGAIESLNSEKFLSLAEQTTVCGAKPISVLIEIAKLKKLKPKLLQYYTSGDLLGDYTNAVGYASISFE